MPSRSWQRSAPVCELSARLVGVVEEAVRPEHVSLWLRK